MLTLNYSDMLPPCFQNTAGTSSSSIYLYGNGDNQYVPKLVSDDTTKDFGEIDQINVQKGLSFDALFQNVLYI